MGAFVFFWDVYMHILRKFVWQQVAKLLCHLSLDKISSEEICFESVIIHFFGGYQL